MNQMLMQQMKREGHRFITLPIKIRNGVESIASIVEYLLDHGADVHFKDENRCTALHGAASKQSKYTSDVMKILVEHGSNFNATDEEGRTPLHYLTDQNTEWTASIVEFLFENLIALHLTACAA